jgi:cytochrome b pre-mRNA-processing protein 3
MFGRLFRTDPMKKPAHAAYEAILAASRRPFLYEEPGAPDTVDGRFDLLLMHAIIFFRHVRTAGEPGAHMNQLVFDRLFDDMDAALREMGTGDPSVGKKIKEMGQAFYGRAEAYEKALGEKDAAALSGIIKRNLFASDGTVSDEPPTGERSEDRQTAAADRLARYLLEADAVMATQDPVALIEGEPPQFPAQA